MNENTYFPFRSPLTHTDVDKVKGLGLKEKIQQFQDDPEKIVRKIDSFLFPSGAKREEFLRNAKREFDTLKEEYNIPVSAYFVISGKNDKNATVYGITDRVYEEKNDEEGKAHAMTLVAQGLVGYLKDTLKTYSSQTHTVDDFLFDVNFSSQYVYGHTTYDSRNAYRLVDIDPQYMGNTVRMLILSLQDVVGGILQEIAQHRKAQGKSTEDLRVLAQSALAPLEGMDVKGLLQDEQIQLDELRQIIFNTLPREKRR